MTVCIAAICDGGNSIVLAADRFRWHSTASIEAEVDEPKFCLLGDNLALMGSGSSSTIEDILRRFNATPADPGLTTVEAAARFQDVCQATRAKQIETEYSKRFLGLKFEDFRATMATAAPGSVVLDLYNRSLNYVFGTILIVAGMDRDGAHVHVVDDGGDVSNTEIGYTAIGSGGVLACVSLARRDHRKSFTIPEALYNVYEAKKTAEMARGVGSATDISIIRKGKPRLNVNARSMAVLRTICDQHKPRDISKQEIAKIAAVLGKSA